MKQISNGFFLQDSWIKWNTTVIMVWVHGNEFSWIEILDEIIKSLDINNWKVYFIYANLKAIEKKIRFIEKNLNRCFLIDKKWSTYEEKRALEIIEILNKADYLLDIHNTISTNSSLEILITTHIDYAKYFNVDKVVSNIDDIQKGWSDWYMDCIWKKWFCLECGSIYFWDKNKTLELAKNSIINFLKVTWNINWIPKEYNLKRLIIKMKYMHFLKTNNFIFTKDYKDFEFIQSWDIIGKDWCFDIKVEKNSYIVFPRKRKNIWDECFCIWEEII